MTAQALRHTLAALARARRSLEAGDPAGADRRLKEAESALQTAFYEIAADNR